MFTVSGFGAAKVAAKKKTTSAAGAVKATTTAGSKVSAKRLQAALALLGKIAGSPSLKAIKVDGAIGPATVTAVNLTFTKHLGPGQAAAQYRTGKLPIDYIKGNADTLAAMIETEIKRRGATPVSTTTAAKASLVTAIKTAPGAAPVSSKEISKRLQLALVTLGKQTGSAKLKAIKVDGAIGPATVAAVNWAFTNHIGAGQAAAQYRTGKLPLDYVKGNASVLAALIETEIKRRGGKVVTASVGTAKKIKTRDGKTVTAQKVDTEEGETYQVTNAKGETYYTTDPTNEEPPEAPADLPEPTAEQHAVAAEASAAASKKLVATKRAPVVSPKQVPSAAAEEAAEEAVAAFSPSSSASAPSAGGESFFSEHKIAILGGVGALAAIGIGVVLYKKSRQNASPSRALARRYS
jgi:hypothetical protein